MIQAAYITHWGTVVPWAGPDQVEHDLALSRALVEIFSEPTLARSLAFRGGTAIHKLVLSAPQRFSEDLDLVQVESGPIGELMRTIRRRLDPVLGRSSFEKSPISHTVTYRVESEIPPTRRLTVKIEINTREHFSVLGWRQRSFSVESPWFAGRAEVQTYETDELYGTKMRALYQRRKGRDLYDLALGLQEGLLDPAAVIRCFLHYMEQEGHAVTRQEFEKNLRAKADRPDFRGDIRPLLAPGGRYDPDEALEQVIENLIAGLPGA